MNQDGALQWDHCVDQLYESVGREDRLAEALGAFRPFFEAKSAVCLSLPTEPWHRSGHLAAVGIEPWVLVEYHSHYFMHDEWARAAIGRGLVRRGRLLRGSELVSPAQLRQSYFWRDFLVRAGVKDIVTTVVEEDGASGPASVVTFHRGLDQPNFTPAAIRTMEQLAPHLRRAMLLHRRLAPQLALGATLRDLYQHMGTPMLFLAADGRVVEHNQAADALLRADASLLHVRHGSLSYRNGRSWSPVAALLAEFRKPGVEHLEASASDHAGRGVSLTLRRAHAALPGQPSEHDPVAVCTLSIVSAKPTALRQRFQLTEAEARIAGLLAAGRSLEQIGDELQVARSTVRTHLRALFGKTGSRRQAELVAKLLSAPTG